MDEFPLPSAVDLKILVYQNVALRRQLDVRRNDNLKLQREISDSRQRLSVAELIARLVLAERGHEEVARKLGVLAADNMSEQFERSLAQLMPDATESASASARCGQMKAEISDLTRKLQVAELEIQQLNLRRTVLLTRASLLPEPAPQTAQAEIPGGSDAEMEKLREEVAKGKSQTAELKAEIAWRRVEGYESLLACLERVHVDRSVWREKAAEVNMELVTFRRETSENMRKLNAEFNEALAHFLQEMTSMSGKLATLEFQKDAAVAVTEPTVARLDQAMQELETFGALIGNMRVDLEGTRQQLGWTEERCDRLQNEVDRMAAEPLGELLGGMTEAADWQRRYRELKSKFDAEIEYRTRLKEANARLKAKLQLVEEKELLKQCERLNEILRQKDDAHNKLMSVHMQVQHQLRLCRDREDALNQRQANIDATVARMHTEIQSLQTHVNSFEVCQGERESEMQVVRVDKENLMRQLVASQQSNSLLENTLVKLKAAVGDIEQDLQEAMTKNTDLNRQLIRAQKRHTVDTLPPDMLQLQIAEFRTMVKCSLCNDNFKDVMLTKCSHCFCRTCVNDNLLTARNRKCPLCGIRFAESDVKPFHLTQ